MPRTTLLPLTVLALVVGGCAHNNPHAHGGGMVAEFCPGKEAELTKTPYKATYVLYHWPPPSDPPPHNWTAERNVVEMYVRGLDCRQPIGFEKTADGKVVAVAGEEKITLEAGRYCWHIDPCTEYTGLKWFVHETGDRITEIVSLPFGLAAFVICLPLLCCFFLLFWPFLMFAA